MENKGEREDLIVILWGGDIHSDNNMDFDTVKISKEEEKEFEEGDGDYAELIENKLFPKVDNFTTWQNIPITENNLKKFEELVEHMKKKLKIAH